MAYWHRFGRYHRCTTGANAVSIVCGCLLRTSQSLRLCAIDTVSRFVLQRCIAQDKMTCTIPVVRLVVADRFDLADESIQDASGASRTARKCLLRPAADRDGSVCMIEQTWRDIERSFFVRPYLIRYRNRYRIGIDIHGVGGSWGLFHEPGGPAQAFVVGFFAFCGPYI